MLIRGVVSSPVRGVVGFGAAAASDALLADFLIVAGGGSGGAYVGGGGGAGGVLTSDALGQVELLVGSYAIVVGLGGPAPPNSSDTDGIDGGDSSAFGFTAEGGGGGGGYSNRPGRPGGSGGGGGSWTGGGALGTAGQGRNGAAGSGEVNGLGGGGGGAGNNASGSSGGAGITSDITGSSLPYARGGPAGNYNSSPAPYPDATRRPGDGGRGGGNNGSVTAGDAGQNGEVIVAYPGAPRGTGGIVTEVGGYTIHRFTASGDLVIE